MSLPFGVSEYTTWPQTFAEDIRLYREAGVEYIEVCEAKLDAANPEPQLQALKDSGLTLSSVQPRLHSLFPDQPRPEPTSPRDRMRRYRSTIELFGRHFPGITLVTITGAAPGGDYDAAYRTAFREYRELAQIAGDCGVRIAVEPLNPILMNTDTFVCTLHQAGRIIDEVGHPAFGLFLDVWHFWEDAGAPELIRKYASNVFGVHINDWRTPRAFGDRYLPGEGEIPLVPLLKTIRESGFAGPYTLEIFSELRFKDSLWADPLRTVTRGREAFQNIWSQVCA